MDPLLVTLTLDPAAQERFERLRRRYFPPERNVVPAHVALFHQLPGSERAAVVAAVEEAARHPGFPVTVDAVRSLGRGVAYRLASPALHGVRERLADRFRPWLTAQDRAAFSPHVTVANKLPPPVARELLAQLQAGFTPYQVRAVGLALWHYRGGPWEPAYGVGFAAGSAAGVEAGQ